MRLSFPVVLLSFFILSFIFGGCTPNNETSHNLDTIEALIDTHPDSALLLLRDIDTTKLRGTQEKARFSLLAAISYDKNFIDTTDISVITPAVDYFTKNGSPDQQMRTRYYQGRIYQNGGNNNQAMASFIHALEFRDFVVDSLLLARLLVAQGLIYDDLYQPAKSLDNYKSAASIYNKKHMDASEKRTLYKALVSSIRLNDRKVADSIFSIINTQTLMTDADKYDYEIHKLSYYIQFYSDSLIEKELSDQLSKDHIPDEQLLNIAQGYSQIGNPHKAFELFKKINPSKIDNRLKFLASAPKIYAEAGHYKEAYDCLNDFYTKTDSNDFKLYSSDILFLENKHRLELKALKEKNTREYVVFWSIAGILTLCSIIVYLRYRFVTFRKNKQLEIENQKLITENLELRITQLSEESERLKEILSSQKELTLPVQQAIKERLLILNGILASKISSNDVYSKPSKQSIEDILQNKEQFMDSTRLAFKVSHPEFIKFLEEHNLTVEEINYVCLYAIGLRGKEVGAYIQLKRHYNISSEIRKKLGLDEHATNLGIYIRRLMHSDYTHK